MLDANLNRAQEGLRVCEDLARFCLDHPALFRSFRRLRHQLASASRSLPLLPRERARARYSRTDLGRRARGSGWPSTTTRTAARAIEHLLLINLQRVKEALRVLEEGSRLAAPRSVATFQRLRFSTYDTERRFLLYVAALRHR